LGDLIIALAIPVFFALIGVEWAVSAVKRHKVLRFFDAISDLSCGIGSQVTGLFLFGALGFVYNAVHERFALFDIQESLATYIVVGVVVDFIYYWWHRASHRTNWIWAAHIVHHHSQDYNLAVALRQAWFTKYSSFLFYLPLAVVGVPLKVFIICELVNTLYQFWIHTRLVGKLGPLEWILNTPSHHRVHHGINPDYIDKNYAGILIIWDRMFGTFVEENEEVVYGTVTPLGTGDPFWANLHYWKEMWLLSKQGESLTDKFYAFFAPPEWTPEGDKEIPPVDATTYEKWTPKSAPFAVPYVVVHFIVATLGLVALLAFKADLSKTQVVIGGLLIMWCTHSFTGLLEDAHRHTRRVVVSEVLRLVLTPLWVWETGASWPHLQSMVTTLSVLSLGSLLVMWAVFGPGGRLERDRV